MLQTKELALWTPELQQSNLILRGRMTTETKCKIIETHEQPAIALAKCNKKP
jgi:hypothetical protein